MPLSPSSLHTTQESKINTLDKYPIVYVIGNSDCEHSQAVNKSIEESNYSRFFKIIDCKHETDNKLCQSPYFPSFYNSTNTGAPCYIGNNSDTLQILKECVFTFIK